MSKQLILAGRNSRFYVLPTPALRALVMRNRQRLLPGCNYVVFWRDVKGYGIDIAIASWVKPGSLYFDP